MKIYKISKIDDTPLAPSSDLYDQCWIAPDGNSYNITGTHNTVATKILKDNLGLNYAQVGHPIQTLLQLKWLRVTSFRQFLEVQNYHPSFLTPAQKTKLIDIALATNKNSIDLEVWGGTYQRVLWEKDNVMDF